VRRAITHAIDRGALPGVDHAAGRGGAIPPVMPGHSDNATLGHNPDMARALLSEAGFPGGEGLPEIVVAVTPWAPVEALGRDLAAVGINARFEVMEKRLGVRPHEHAWYSGWHADYPDPDGFYLGFLELDLPLYRDDETNSILARARASRDRDERLRLYREFERIWIGERAALVPLSYARQLTLRRPHVQDLRLNPMRVFHLEQVVVTPPDGA
jgi:ABC-type transport system substrate-binding protein